jgi:hypothetical protein
MTKVIGSLQTNEGGGVQTPFITSDLTISTFFLSKLGPLDKLINVFG